MSFFSSLISKSAKEDAKTIRGFIQSSPDNLSQLAKSYSTELSNTIDSLVYREMSIFTSQRLFYELNKARRKRNYIFSKIGNFSNKSSKLTPVFIQFQGSDKELVSKFAYFNLPVETLKKYYRRLKYKTRDLAYLQFSLEKRSLAESGLKNEIKKFGDYFFGKD
jgi:hypothetical protein